MSIPVLSNVYEEVRRLSIAGSVVAPGDFRLKKLVAPLEQAGQKAPVFAKVAQAVSKVVDSTDKTSAEALLELSTLVNAILYTQGDTGIEGTLEPIPTTDLGQHVTQTSARTLKPLLEALTSTGSGRLEIIQNAYERGNFRDLRLIRPALSALDDTYAEIADFVAEKILPLYGAAILTELQSKFDQKGRGGHVRRLALMHKLDPAGTREFVKQALEEGSKEVRVAAIECLGESPEDLTFLLDQAKSRAKDVREAALKGLARSDSADAAAVLRKALNSDDIEMAVGPIRDSKNPDVLKFAIEEGIKQRDTLLANKEKDKKVASKLVGRFCWLLECFRGRDDKATEAFLLETFARRHDFLAIKGDFRSGVDIPMELTRIMIGGSKKVQETLADAHASLSDLHLSDAFQAACQVWTAKKVYDEFSPYVTMKTGEKAKKGDKSAAKQQAVVSVISEDRDWRHYCHVQKIERTRKPLDPRWLDLAVKLEHLEMVQSLVRPGHPATIAFLSKTIAEQLEKQTDPHELAEVLQTMLKAEHPGTTDALITAIRKFAKGTRAWGLFWLAQVIPQMPKQALPALEELLPTLPEKMVDELMEAVTELKNKI